jgi:hypothetical protein
MLGRLMRRKICQPRAPRPGRARVAQDDAVQQAPLDVGQADASEDLPAARAQADRRDLLVGADRLHHRDELASDERKRHEGRRQDQAGRGEDDLEVMLAQPSPHPPLQPEDEHEDQPGDHRRDGEGQIDQRSEQRASRKAETRHCPRGGDAEDDVQGHSGGGDAQREQDGADGIRIVEEIVPVRADPVLQRAVEDVDDRNDDQDTDHQQRGADQGDAHRGRIGLRASGGCEGASSCHGAWSTFPED